MLERQGKVLELRMLHHALINPLPINESLGIEALSEKGNRTSGRKLLLIFKLFLPLLSH